MICLPIAGAILGLATRTHDAAALASVPEPGAYLLLAPATFEPVPFEGAHRLGHDGMYVQVGLGFVTTQDSDGPDEEIDFDEGFAVPIAVGRRFGAEDTNTVAFDVELEGIYTDQDADETGVLEAVRDVTVLGGLLNGVGEWSLGERLSLYGGAGLGLSFLEVGTEGDALNDFEDEDGPFLTWQLKAGARLWSSETVAWSLGYRFLNVDDAEIDDDIGSADFDLETQQHVFELGLRFML